MAIESVSGEPATTCIACGGTTQRTRATPTFERGDVHVVVENVPVARCRACDEQCVAGSLGVTLSDDVDRILSVLETTLTDTVALTKPRSLVVRASERDDLAMAV